MSALAVPVFFSVTCSEGLLPIVTALTRWGMNHMWSLPHPREPLTLHYAHLNIPRHLPPGVLYQAIAEASLSQLSHKLESAQSSSGKFIFMRK